MTVIGEQFLPPTDIDTAKQAEQVLSLLSSKCDSRLVCFGDALINTNCSDEMRVELNWKWTIHSSLQNLLPSSILGAAGLTDCGQDISLQRLPADAAVKDVAIWTPDWPAEPPKPRERDTRKPEGSMTLRVQSTNNQGL